MQYEKKHVEEEVAHEVAHDPPVYGEGKKPKVRKYNHNPPIKQHVYGDTHHTRWGSSIGGPEAPVCGQPLYTAVVDEGSPVSQQIMRAAAIDPNNSPLIWSIEDTTFSRFSIDRITGDIVVTASLKRAAIFRSAIEFRVRATNEKGLYCESTIRINVIPRTQSAAAAYGPSFGKHSLYNKPPLPPLPLAPVLPPPPPPPPPPLPSPSYGPPVFSQPQYIFTGAYCSYGASVGRIQLPAPGTPNMPMSYSIMTNEFRLDRDGTIYNKHQPGFGNGDSRTFSVVASSDPGGISTASTQVTIVMSGCPAAIKYRPKPHHSSPYEQAARPPPPPAPAYESPPPPPPPPPLAYESPPPTPSYEPPAQPPPPPVYEVPPPQSLPQPPKPHRHKAKPANYVMSPTHPHPPPRHPPALSEDSKYSRKTSRNPMFSSLSYSFVVDCLPANYFVGVVAANDPHNNHLINYNLIGAVNEFKIDPNSGEVRSLSSLKQNGDRIFTILASDQFGYSSSVPVRVTVNGCPHGGYGEVETVGDPYASKRFPNGAEKYPPKFSQPLYQFTVACDAPVGYQVGQVSAIDKDGTSITYSLYLAPSVEFNINAQTGLITTAIPYSQPYTSTLKILATDGHGQTSTAIIQISIVNCGADGYVDKVLYTPPPSTDPIISDGDSQPPPSPALQLPPPQQPSFGPPTFPLQSFYFSVVCAAPAYTVVGSVPVNQVNNGGQVVSYGTSDGRFQVDADGHVHITFSPVSAGHSPYTFTVTARDAYDRQALSTVTVNVVGCSANPNRYPPPISGEGGRPPGEPSGNTRPVFVPGSFQFTLQCPNPTGEQPQPNAIPPGALVGVLTATDYDNDHLIFSIADNSGIFIVNSLTGQITTTNLITANNIFTFVAYVRDKRGSGESSSATVAVNVVGCGPIQPPGPSGPPISPNDPQINNHVIHAPPTFSKPIFILHPQCIFPPPGASVGFDGVGGSSITAAQGGAAGQIPVDVQLGISTSDSNLGILPSSGFDGAGGSSITAAEGGAAGQIPVDAQLGFVATNPVNLPSSGFDGAGGTSITGAVGGAPGFIPVGTQLGLMTATDPRGGPLIYKFGGNAVAGDGSVAADSRISIQPETGAIVALANLPFGTTIVTNVIAMNAHGQQASTQVSIIVSCAAPPHPPTSTVIASGGGGGVVGGGGHVYPQCQPPVNVDILENSPPGSFVAQLGGAVGFTLFSSTESNFFNVGPTGRVTLARSPDRESLDAFCVLVQDQNDNAPIFSHPSYEFLTTCNVYNAFVGRVMASDYDTGRYGLMKYEIVAGNIDSPGASNLFNIDSCTGELRTNGNLVATNYLQGNGRTITVRASSPMDPLMQSTVAVTVRC